MLESILHVCVVFRCTCGAGCTMVVRLCVMPAPHDQSQSTRRPATGMRILSFNSRCATSPGQPSCAMCCTALGMLRQRRRRKLLRRRYVGMQEMVCQIKESTHVATTAAAPCYVLALLHWWACAAVGGAARVVAATLSTRFTGCDKFFIVPFTCSMSLQ